MTKKCTFQRSCLWFRAHFTGNWTGEFLTSQEVQSLMSRKRTQWILSMWISWGRTSGGFFGCKVRFSIDHCLWNVSFSRLWSFEDTNAASRALKLCESSGICFHIFQSLFQHQHHLRRRFCSALDCFELKSRPLRLLFRKQISLVSWEHPFTGISFLKGLGLSDLSCVDFRASFTCSLLVQWNMLKNQFSFCDAFSGFFILALRVIVTSVGMITYEPVRKCCWLFHNTGNWRLPRCPQRIHMSMHHASIVWWTAEPVLIWQKGGNRKKKKRLGWHSCPRAHVPPRTLECGQKHNLSYVSSPVLLSRLYRRMVVRR